MPSEKIHALISTSKTVSINEDTPNYPILEINHPHATAKVALHGAHLYEWVPNGEQAVIYNSPDSVYKEGKAIRGGVPICWPWFNAHPTDSSLPGHGLARNRFWELDEISESSEATVLTLLLSSNPKTQNIWPYEFKVTTTISIGKEADIQLKTYNTGTKPFTIGGALHTYLSVGDISAVKISGLDGIDYIDTVGSETLRTQSGNIIIDQEVDRIYTNTSHDIALEDNTLGREISVSRNGSQSAVIWNPWIEKAKSLGDLPNSAYRDFLCIEAANARGDVYELAPNEEHTLGTTIKIL